LRDAATATSKKALWNNFITEYEKVYVKALAQNKKSNK
jgi:predicted PolB exonuclease-like 3'-5' exonuclease